MLKFPRGEGYGMLIVKTGKIVGVTELVSNIWQVQYATFSPYMNGAIWPFYELQEQLQYINKD